MLGGCASGLYTGPMNTHADPGSAARSALRMGGLLIVLAGLFGMHGLDSHGTAGMDTIAHAVLTEPALAAVAAEHDPATMVMAVQDGSTAVVVSIARAVGEPSMGMGMAGTCMAVLGLALIALLRFLRINRVRALSWVVPLRASAPGDAGRDPDPPSLIDLSIQRC